MTLTFQISYTNCFIQPVLRKRNRNRPEPDFLRGTGSKHENKAYILFRGNTLCPSKQKNMSLMCILILNFKKIIVYIQNKIV